MERYGVPVPILSKESIRKSTLTKIKRYGTPYPLQNPDILEKCRETMRQSTGKDLIPISKNQYFLHDLYGGILNYKVNSRYVDILLDDNICFEYDGGGHRLNVYKGKLTDEEFDKKEAEREIEIVSCGYKIFRIISRRDKLPDSDVLLKIKDVAYNKLKTFDVYRYYTYDNSEKSYNV